MTEPTFDISRFRRSQSVPDQYERQLRRLASEDREVTCIEKAVSGSIENLRSGKARSFVIYGEPQSGKTEMMICLTGKLLDEGYDFILHLLNDSVDLLGQNLGRFKSSGLAPAARNFSEILDPAFKLEGQQHVVFCKKNGSDLRKLIDKIGKRKRVVVVDDEADYASPNAKVNSGGNTTINDLIGKIIGDTGYYIGVTATPARLDLNNTFDNDSAQWIDFPPHSKYTGQDVFFPLEGSVQYFRSLLVCVLTRPVLIDELSEGGRLSSYILDGRIGLHIKHSSQRLSPWPFTLTKQNYVELAALAERCDEVFIVLVCGSDGMACMSLSELVQMTGAEPEGQSWLRAARRRGQWYTLTGANSEDGKKKPDGIAALVAALNRPITQDNEPLASQGRAVLAPTLMERLTRRITAFGK